ncbi:hypothetical protein QAD02_000688 [Eretmocerus hayati]|uniref:Uncharacterized protein n=1 Tax=Eretmocerus hayati TaxID=131215 RepID=A0ACC2NDY0_9HYME|nr:hypothetical protein QAD02_000688 [Eretmocerus hayati]
MMYPGILGVVKTASRLKTSSVVGNRVVRGITNGSKVLEINLPANEEVDHIMEGDHVKVIGVAMNKIKGSHVIKVSNFNDIVEMTDNMVESSKYSIDANTHISI